MRTIFPTAVGAFGAGLFTADTIIKREAELAAEGMKDAVVEGMKDVIPDVTKAVKEAVEETMEKAFSEEFEKALVDAVKKALRQVLEERENGVDVNEAEEETDEDIVKDV